MTLPHGSGAEGGAGDPSPPVGRRVVVAGGGTAGHAYPAVAAAQALAADRDQILMVGTPGGPEASLAAQSGFGFEPVSVMGLERRISLKNLLAGLKLAGATVKALALVGRFDPDAALSTGGYVSLPVALASRIHRVPLVIHEQNAIPGLSNRIAARLADAVALSFPASAPAFSGPLRWRRGHPRVVVTGNPVRAAIAGLDRRVLRPEALKTFGLEEGRRTLVIFGGSQGARRINEAALEAYNRWRQANNLQVLHLTGRRAHAELSGRLEELRAKGDGVLWRMFDYTERMDLAYAVAELAICRAGASTIAEIAAAGLPAVLVPYPYAAEGHQAANAEAVREAGGAEVVRDDELNGDTLSRTAESLLADEGRLAGMSQAIATLAVADAAGRLAELVHQVAGATA